MYSKDLREDSAIEAQDGDEESGKPENDEKRSELDDYVRNQEEERDKEVEYEDKDDTDGAQWEPVNASEDRMENHEKDGTEPANTTNEETNE